MPGPSFFSLPLLLLLLFAFHGCLLYSSINASPTAAAATSAGGPAPASVYAATNCALIRPLFEARNASALPPPITPVDGRSLTVCTAEYSCCTAEMESNLKKSVKKEFLSSMQRNSQSVQGILASMAIHFQDYIRQMMLKVENRTMRLFREVFGVETPSTDEYVRQFFADLERHLKDRPTNAATPEPWSRSGVGETTEDRFGRVTESFFARLFPYMYQATLTRNRRQLDTGYRQCLETRMDAIFPAMEAVHGLQRDLSATLEATKVLIAALEMAARALNSTNLAALVEPSLTAPVCNDALLRVAYCAACAGRWPPTKPCAGYCLNVARGCMAPLVAQLDSHWSAFYEALRKLMSVVNRGQSLVCLEDLLRSLLSRIAEPMLTLTEHSEHVHLKAKFICGQTKWANESSLSPEVENGTGTEDLGVVRGVTVSKLPGGRPDWSMDEDDFNFRSTLLSNKIRQFEESVPRSVAFYATLADAFCRDDDGMAETRPNVACWNGDRIAEYAKTVPSIQMTSQKYNPELPPTSQLTVDPRIADLVDRLGRMKRLIQRHISTSPESESLYQPTTTYDEGSGSGDGSQMSLDGVSDDEDAMTGWQEQGSGSGDLAAVTQLPGSESDIGPVDNDVNLRTIVESEAPAPPPPPPPQQQPPLSSSNEGAKLPLPQPPPPAGGKAGVISPSHAAVLVFISGLLYLANVDVNSILVWITFSRQVAVRCQN